MTIVAALTFIVGLTAGIALTTDNKSTRIAHLSLMVITVIIIGLMLME